MKSLPRALLAIATIGGLVSTASAADLAYKVKAPVMAAPVYSWSGFYGGFYGGVTTPNSSNFAIDPGTQTVGTAGTGLVNFGPVGPGGFPVFSAAPPAPPLTPIQPSFNGLAGGGLGQVSNTIIPGGVNCSGLVNCNVGGLAATTIVPNVNPGFRTDAMFPSSQSGTQQTAALFGLEVGARKQFDNNFVLGIGADITGFSKGGTTNFTSNGSFFNSNGFVANSQALGCVGGVLGIPGTCQTIQNLNTSGSVITVNSGGSSASLQINANPNWVGTVRASAGYAFDRVLIFGSAGLAYSDAKLNVTGTYRDTATSACQGVSNVYTASTNAGVPGQSFVGFQCGAGILNSASVSQVTSTAITYSGNRGGGMLTGFAAGGGAAYAVTDHISLLLEGVYYNLGTVRATVTGTGTQATTTTNIGATNTIPGAGITANGNTQTTVVTAAAATPFTVSKTIDGAIFKGGIQFKF